MFLLGSSVEERTSESPWQKLFGEAGQLVRGVTACLLIG